MKFLLPIILSAFALSFSSTNTTAEDTASLSTLEASSQSNGFVYSNVKKQADDSFVYTGYLNFESGKAGGLVFGGEKDDHCFVFNMDRSENKVKVLYFDYADGDYVATELLCEPFIGNDKMTQSEKNMVEPKVKTLDQVNLKVIVTMENDKAYAEFYADGIKRFGVDNTYDLNALNASVQYDGGYLGLNVYDGSVSLTDICIGKSDYSYYSELYRNQYHFSQFAHWNNDPNGLVYYKGYYHLYFQTHPFSEYWSDMYWGHARSKDLIHWENLPICLFPDDGTMSIGTGDGYMWSGSAMVYHSGMSDAIDELNWFGEEGEGLIAFFTRDGSSSQDQVIMSSDDEGMTWTKRRLIPQSLSGISGRKIDFRDPKVFPVVKEDGKVTLWGMSVSDMNSNRVYFLESSNLLDWKYSSSFAFYRPECLDVFTLDDNGVDKDVITVCGRYYLTGKLSYEDRIIFRDENGNDISELSLENINSSIMDYGPDSYATQSFYIDDTSSEYYGKTVSMSWYSGVPGDSKSVDSGTFAQVRHPWNGGGFTIPVVYSMSDSTLQETPVTRGNSKLDKSNVVLLENEEYDSNKDTNLLQDVNSHLLEIDATITNPDSSSLSFRIDVSDKEYLEIGWNVTDGYYVDRSHLSCANLSFSNYNAKYSSHIIGDTTKQTFYILSDNGGVEVFANDFKTPFYVLTLASPYSTKAEFNSAGKVNFTYLEVNEVSSAYRDDSDSDEGLMYLSSTEMNLDTSLHTEETLTAYCTNKGEIQFEVEEGNDFIELVADGNEAHIQAKNEGEAVIRVYSGTIEKTCIVTVHNGSETALPFDESGIKAGQFYKDNDSIVGINNNGDGYLLSSKKGTDFLYQANIDMTEAKAAALIIKASADMSNYICINYDKSLSACKVWSNKRELAYVNKSVDDLSSVSLSVQCEEDNLTVSLNGEQVVDTTLDEDERKEGYFGLNVFQGKAIFSSIDVSNLNYEYSGGDFSVSFTSLSSLKSVINVTEKNTNVPLSYCQVRDNTLTIRKEYFATLKEKKTYTFLVQGYSESYRIHIDVKEIPVIALEDKTITEKENAVFFIGSRKITSITLNGVELNEEQYIIKDYTITIYSSSLKTGDNILKIDDEEVTITVKPLEHSGNSKLDETDTKNQNKTSMTLYIILMTVIGVILSASLLVVYILRKEKRKWRAQ